MDKLVLDNNHGIETKVVETTTYREETSGEAKVVYLPWYIKLLLGSRNGFVTRYYTRIGGWETVECNTWEAAYNHIARSRGLPTSKQVGSTYVQEARNAGILPETPRSQAQPNCPERDVLTTYSLLVSNVGWVRSDCPDYAEVKQLFDEYAESKQYEQVTMWSSDEHDPIEEAYTASGL